MNDNSTHIELLIRYLDGTLNAEEKKSLEAELGVNKEMQNDLNTLRLARETVVRQGLRDDIARVRAVILKESSSQARPVITMNRRRNLVLGIAASLILLLVGGIAYQYLNVSSRGLYEELYKPYAEGTYRGESATNNLQHAYAAKQYSTVVQIFRSLSQPSAKDFFLAGQSFLAEDSVSAAINSFQQVQRVNQKNATTIFQDDAEYYEGLAFLKTGQIDSAVAILSNIKANKDHLYHDKVTNAVMRKLKMLSIKK